MPENEKFIPFVDPNATALFDDGGGWTDENTSIALDPMSIQTFAELKTAVTNWMARPELNSQVNDFIAIAESRMNRRLRLQLMEQVSVFSIQYQQSPVPLLFRGVRSLKLDSPRRQLKYISPEQYYDRYADNATGAPRDFTILNQRIYFGPVPDGTYSGILIYWRGFQPLSDESPTNDLLTYHPDMYLFGSLVAGEMYLHNDPRFAMWRQEHDRILQEMVTEDRRDRVSGSALQPNRRVKEAL